MKHFIKPLVVLSISAVLLGVAVYLHSIDHPTLVPFKGIGYPLIPYNGETSHPIHFYRYVMPPWYASLWPIPLVVGIAELAYSAYSAIRSLKK